MNSINFANYINKVRNSRSLRVMSLTFIGMLLALVVDVLLAARLGTSQTTDALVIAFSLPKLIDTVSRDGIKFSFIPLFIERRKTLSEKAFNRFVSGIINVALVFGIIVTILFEILAPGIVKALAPGFSSAGTAEATLLFRACVPLVVFAPANAILSVLLNSQKRFYGVALRNAVAPGFMLAGFGLAWGRSNVALWVAIAYAVGFAVFFLTLFTDATRSGYQHSWKSWSSRNDLSRLWEAGFLPTLGFILGQLGRLITRQVLVSFVAVGAIASFYFAVRLVSAAQSIIGVSIATTSLPAMTEHELTGQKSRLASAMRKNMVKVLLVSLPAVIFIVFFNQTAIDLLYGYGSFNEAAIAQTSQVFTWLGLSLIFISIVPVINAGLYALRAYRAIFYIMFGMALVSVFLAWLFLQWLGLIGIAISTPLAALINVIVIICVLQRLGVNLILTKK